MLKLFTQIAMFFVVISITNNTNAQTYKQAGQAPELSIPNGNFKIVGNDVLVTNLNRSLSSRIEMFKQKLLENKMATDVIFSNNTITIKNINKKFVFDIMYQYGLNPAKEKKS